MPPMPINARLEGLGELKTQLAQLPKYTQKRVLERALLKAAQPILADARRLVAVDTGALRDSLQATTLPPHGVATGRKVYGATIAAGGSVAQARAAAKALGPQPAVVYVGPGRNPQSSLIEFGTSLMPPQPYMRPAWDINRDKVPSIVGPEIWAEIQKAVQRRSASRRLK